MQRLSFVEHPASVGETYAQHLRSAWWFSICMVGAGLACFVHGLLPFLFVSTGSSMIRRLHDKMIVNRCRSRAAARVFQSAALLTDGDTKAFGEAKSLASGRSDD